MGDGGQRLVSAIVPASVGTVLGVLARRRGETPCETENPPNLFRSVQTALGPWPGHAAFGEVVAAKCTSIP